MLRSILPFLFFGLLLMPRAARSAPTGQGYPYAARTIIDVSDKENGELLIGAAVTITSGKTVLHGVTAKHDAGYRIVARYECPHMFRDSVTLEVSCMGYKPYRERFPGVEFVGRREVRLEVDEKDIAQVVVVGKRVAMVIRGDTTVYDAAAFKTLEGDRFEELLRQLPGVRIENNKIYAGNDEVKRVYVDGRNLFGQQAAAALTDLDAGDVKQVRIYEERNPETERMGVVPGKKEKVMNVETKSGRSILLGGEVNAMGGASLRKDYSERREIRHAEAGEFYRHSERASLRFQATNAKDAGRTEVSSPQARIMPSKSTEAMLSFDYHHGDSTDVRTYTYFSRNRSSAVSSSLLDYFPTQAYALRREESLTQSLSKSISGGIGNMTRIMRGRNVFSVDASASFGDESSGSSNRSLQQIDDASTRTLLHTDRGNRRLELQAMLRYRRKLSQRSGISFWVSGNYASHHDDDRSADTTASEVALRTLLGGRQYADQRAFGVGAEFETKTGTHSQFSAGYDFQGDYQWNKRRMLDYLDDPKGVVDTVNSSDYTVDYYRHNLTAQWMYYTDKFSLFAVLRGSIYDIARDDKFPVPSLSPRRFYELNPIVNFALGPQHSRFSFNVGMTSQMISVESLRDALNTLNPVQLSAGNPDLKLPKSFDSRAEYTLTSVRHASVFSLGVTGRYIQGAVITGRRLFLEDTYLPQYDYTARKGAQLTYQQNGPGNYQVGGDMSYSRQLAALRSTLRINLGYNFAQNSYYLDEVLRYSTGHTLNLQLGLNTGFSSKVRIGLNSDTSAGTHRTLGDSQRDLRELLRCRIDLSLGRYFGNLGTAYEFYCNSRSKSLTRNAVVFSASAGRKFGKNSNLWVSVGFTDLSNDAGYSATRFDTDYVSTSTTSYLGGSGYLKAVYRF